MKNFLSSAIFKKKLSNGKQSLINKDLPNHFIDNQIILFLSKVSNSKTGYKEK